MMTMKYLRILISLLAVSSLWAWSWSGLSSLRSKRTTNTMKMTMTTTTTTNNQQEQEEGEETRETLHVMINGLPGPMALEVAKACLARHIALVPIGFTGPSTIQQNISVQEQPNYEKIIELVKGPGHNSNALLTLKELKRTYPGLVIVDYTHPSAVVNNIQAYTDAGCDFVLGTTGFDRKQVDTILETGKNYAIIAPNMAKQIVALQSAVEQTAKRFPGSFSGYHLQVKESHQSSKADTSGTAKAIVSHLSTLTTESFAVDDIEKIRNPTEQLAFGVPEDHLKGHAFHTYRLLSNDGSVSFELQHNVCGRRIYAEGTVDAVHFLHRLRSTKPIKRIYNMIDVLEAGEMK